jgi:long-chain acyl-CoA synthetase
MFADVLAGHARDRAEKIALRVRRRGSWQEWTYGRAWTAARSAAGRLRALGAGPGTQVALFADNSPEWVLAYLGIHLAGATVVPLDAQYSQREASTILDFLDCRLVVCSEATAPVVDAVKTGHTVDVLRLENPTLFDTPVCDPAVRSGDDLMTIIFTCPRASVFWTETSRPTWRPS